MSQPPTPDDRELVEAIRRNDPAGMSELVRRYMRPAFSVAWRILRQREDAEDLVQEAFVTVHQKIHTFDINRPFRPWFFRILVNKGINAKASRRLRSTEEIPADRAAADPSPQEFTENREIERAFQNAFETLGEKQRMIVRLFDLEGFSSGEIGEILDLSDGTVRWHLHQARAALRDVLTPLREVIDE